MSIPMFGFINFFQCIFKYHLGSTEITFVQKLTTSRHHQRYNFRFCLFRIIYIFICITIMSFCFFA